LQTRPQPSRIPTTTLYVARHGQSEWNNQSLITGQTDIGLSAKGLEQARSLARCLAEVELAAIYTSALQRTVATAEPTAAAKAMAIEPVAALNEIHLGVLQGRHRDERDPEAQALWARWQAELWTYRVPGGERFDEFAQRVGQAVQAIVQRHEGQSVLIVGHRATNRVVLGILLNWPRERWIDLRLRNKFFYRIGIGAEPQVETIALSGSKAGLRQPGLVM